MRGRYPAGPEFVDHLPGSALAKERARVLLETIAGKCRVQDACTKLGISEPRFDQLRIHGLEHLVQSMEPRLAGRPPQTPTPAEEQVRELQSEVAALRMQVRIAQARAEVALVLPNAVQSNGAVSSNDEAGKKTNPPRHPPQHQQRRPRTRAPAPRKPT